MIRKLTVGVILLLAVASYAARVELNIKDIEPQQGSHLCWAASMQCLLDYYGVHVTQEQILLATWGRVANFPIYDLRQAVLSFVKENARVAPQGKVIHPFFRRGAPPPALLIYELELEKSPVFIGYHNPQGHGSHCVICYGVEYDGSPENPLITQILILDPWDGKRKAWSGREMAPLMEGIIALRVADAPPADFILNGRHYRVTPTFDTLDDSGIIEGRICYSNELGKWIIYRNDDLYLGPIPRNSGSG